MINDYLWTTLYAQHQAELRASARRRGGDTASSVRPRSGPVGWLRLRRHVATARPAPRPSAAATSAVTPAAAVTAAEPAMTAAAVAWARLASGAGNLEPATGSRTEPERDAA